MAFLDINEEDQTALRQLALLYRNGQLQMRNEPQLRITDRPGDIVVARSKTGAPPMQQNGEPGECEIEIRYFDGQTYSEVGPIDTAKNITAGEVRANRWIVCARENSGQYVVIVEDCGPATEQTEEPPA